MATVCWRMQAAAGITAGNKGLQALIKCSASEALWTHYMIHFESVAVNYAQK
jgi:hypothetical protein